MRKSTEFSEDQRKKQRIKGIEKQESRQRDRTIAELVRKSSVVSPFCSASTLLEGSLEVLKWVEVKGTSDERTRERRER